MVKLVEIKMNNGDTFYLFPREKNGFTSVDFLGKYIGRGGNSLIEVNTTKDFDGDRVYINADNVSSAKGLME